jgi:hypothetical protein
MHEPHPAYGFFKKSEIDAMAHLCPRKNKEVIKKMKQRAAVREAAYMKKAKAGGA